MNRTKIGKYLMYLGFASVGFFLAGFMISPFAWFALVVIFPPTYLVFVEQSPLAALAGPLGLLILAAFYIILGAVVWFSGVGREKKVKTRVIAVEDQIREITRMIRGLNLSSKYEETLTSTRKEVSDLYSYVRYGERRDNTLDKLLQELRAAVMAKDQGNIKSNIASLKGAIADLKSEFKR